MLEILSDESFNIGDIVQCNILYTNISFSEYIRRLKLIAGGKQASLVKEMKGHLEKTTQFYIQMPIAKGKVVGIKKVLQNQILTVKCGKEEIALMDSCWNMMLKKGG